MNAWLHRHGKPTWQFSANQAHGELVHKTKYGGLYAIFSNHKKGKPFWVGRCVVDAGGRITWVDCGTELQASSIEFEGAGWYRF